MMMRVSSFLVENMNFQVLKVWGEPVEVDG